MVQLVGVSDLCDLFGGGLPLASKNAQKGASMWRCVSLSILFGQKTWTKKEAISSRCLAMVLEVLGGQITGVTAPLAIREALYEKPQPVMEPPSPPDPVPVTKTEKIMAVVKLVARPPKNGAFSFLSQGTIFQKGWVTGKWVGLLENLQQMAPTP